MVERECGDCMFVLLLCRHDLLVEFQKIWKNPKDVHNTWKISGSFLVNVKKIFTSFYQFCCQSTTYRLGLIFQDQIANRQLRNCLNLKYFHSFHAGVVSTQCRLSTIIYNPSNCLLMLCISLATFLFSKVVHFTFEINQMQIFLNGK